jgi:hypothetical protein
LQVVLHLLQGGLAGLSQRDPVVGVAHRLVQPVDLGGEALGDCESRGVVLCAVDAQTRGQPLQGLRQSGRVVGEIPLCIQRKYVGIDDLAHGKSPSIEVFR